jgi:predicted pyridoxine 5'-phosphate oxidase superfamily flavin-nucleotide-binding protein
VRIIKADHQGRLRRRSTATRTRPPPSRSPHDHAAASRADRQVTVRGIGVATCRAAGRDCSPRGDLPGFVRVHDEKTLMMPDRRGNNRACSLRNLVRDPRMALFLIPGSDSTVRFNGRAQISIDPGLLRSFRVDAKARREYHAKPRTR